MRTILAALAAAVILAAGQAHGGALAPAPQIVAEYDRGFIERSGAQTFGEMLDTGIVRYFFTGGRDLLIMVNGRPTRRPRTIWIRSRCRRSSASRCCGARAWGRWAVTRRCAARSTSC